MERISIFNYEAFYLDHLEGNLNEKDTALLLEFLAANPDLVMEDAELPSYESESINLDSQLKEKLKQPFVSDKITPSNVEFFMISAVENQLPSEKEIELNQFIEQHPSYLIDADYYSKVILEANESVRYADKSSLKKKQPIVLWPYITAAASVLVSIMIWTSFNDEKIVDTKPTTFKAEKPTEIKSVGPKEVQTDIVRPSAPVFRASQITPIRKEKHIKQDDTLEVEEEINPILEEQERQPVNQVFIALEEKKDEPVSKQAWQTEEAKTSAENDYAALHFSEMQNPIEPVTKFISNKTEKKVEFRSAKKTAKSAGGFFLKVGKFELSRKRH